MQNGCGFPSFPPRLRPPGQPGSVTVRDSKGVYIGDYGTQANTFTD